MEKVRPNIQLTDDPMTNIRIMVPLINDEARKAISYLMYGCYLGEAMAGEKKAATGNRESVGER